jgi:hypothetical protein
MSGGINAVPTDNFIAMKDGRLTLAWQAFFSSIHDWLSPVGQSGTTAQRPPDSARNPLYIGQIYFDTTLGKPIWVKARNSTVWVDATGASV